MDRPSGGRATERQPRRRRDRTRGAPRSRRDSTGPASPADAPLRRRRRTRTTATGLPRHSDVAGPSRRSPGPTVPSETLVTTDAVGPAAVAPEPLAGAEPAAAAQPARTSTATMPTAAGPRSNARPTDRRVTAIFGLEGALEPGEPAHQRDRGIERIRDEIDEARAHDVLVRQPASEGEVLLLEQLGLGMVLRVARAARASACRPRWSRTSAGTPGRPGDRGRASGRRRRRCGRPRAWPSAGATSRRRRTPRREPCGSSRRDCRSRRTRAGLPGCRPPTRGTTPRHWSCKATCPSRTGRRGRCGRATAPGRPRAGCRGHGTPRRARRTARRAAPSAGARTQPCGA